MNKLINTISFRIWLPFAIIVTAMMAVFAVYYPARQSSLFFENKKHELSGLCETVALGVELSLNADDFEGLRKTIDFVKKTTDFEYVAIITRDTVLQKESLFTSYPVLPDEKILTLDSVRNVYAEYPFRAKSLSGVIRIATSKDKMLQLVRALNRPIYALVVVMLVIFLIIFYFIAKRVSRPLQELTKAVRLLESQNFQIDLPQPRSQDEVGALQSAFSSLRSTLAQQRKENEELLVSLESRVDRRTAELKRSQEKLLLSQQKARIGNYEYFIQEDRWETSAVFDEILLVERHAIYQLKDFLHRVHPEFLEELRSYFLGSYTTVGKLEVDFKVKGLVNEQDRWIMGLFEVKYDQYSQPYSITGIMQDITERKEFEEEVNRLSLVAKYTSNCVVITDKDRRIIWVNQSLIDLSGYSFEEMIGQSPKMFQFEKTDMVQSRNIREALDRHESVINAVVLNRGKYGNEYWLSLNIVPFFNKEGQLQGYIAVETDITEQKKSDLALRESEKKNRDILDNSSELIHMVDLDGNISWVNRAWLENMRSSLEACIGQPIQQFVDPSSQSTFEFMFAQANSGEELGEVNCIFITALGERMYLKGKVIPLLNAESQVIGFQSYFHNVTKIVLAEQNLKKINESLERKVQENTNRNLELTKSIVEYEKLASIGEIAAGIAHDLNTPLSTIKVGAETLQTTIHTLINEQILKCNSDQVLLALQLVANIQLETFVSGSQLLKEKRVMHELLKTHYPSTAEIRPALAEALVRCRIKPEDDSIIASLVLQQNTLDVVELVYLLQTSSRLIDTIINSVDKSSNVVKNIRAYVKSDPSSGMKSVNLHQNIATVLSLFNHQLTNHIHLSFDVAQDLHVKAFEIKLFQLWSNLVKNAIDAMRDQKNKSIIVKSTVAANKVTVSVINNGPAIPPDDLDRIFTKFFTTKQHYNGTGLGLSIVKNVVNEHDGMIQVFSNANQTEFAVTLALDSEEASL